MYILYQVFIAITRPDASPAMAASEAHAGMSDQEVVLRAVSSLAPPIILIVAVLGSILAGIATPTEAAAVGAIGALLLAGHRLDRDKAMPIYIAGLSLVGLLVLTAMVDLRVTRRVIPTGDMIGIGAAVLLTAGLIYGMAVSLVRVFREQILQAVMKSTAQISAMVFTILIGAALFSLVFRGLGGDETVHKLLEDIPGGVFGAMLAVMIVMFIMGFFLDFIEITFVVVPIVAPILLLMGLNPIWLGVMMAMNLQTSFLTPPFGFALFYLRGVAPPQITTMDIYRGAIPFVAIQLVGLAIIAMFPALATWFPGVVFG